MGHYSPTHRPVGTNPDLIIDALSTTGAVSVGTTLTVVGQTTLSTSLTGVLKATSGVVSAAALLNADVSASAAIAFSKLATLTAGSILLGNASNVPTATALTGDVTINSSGVTAIASGVIVNADINASAAISYSKLALTGAILNADLAGSIAYSKLVLTGAILNADLAGSIAYSKLSLTGAILNADLAGSIAGSKVLPNFVAQNITTTGNISAGQEIKATFATAGSTAQAYIRQTDNANTASNARLRLEVGGASGGDPYVMFLIDGVSAWKAGTDNSDSDNWKLDYDTGAADSMGTGTWLSITTTGIATFSGQLIGKGTATNNSAAAGYIGEYVESIISSATNMAATTVWGNMTSISLTAGDWDVSGLMEINGNGATFTSSIAAAISVNAASTPDHVAGSNQAEQTVSISTANGSVMIANYRLSLSATTTVYFKQNATYSAGTPRFRARLSARRER